MREESLEYMVCPLCGGGNLSVTVHTRNSLEIREGEVVCRECGRAYPIEKGILNLMPEPTQTIEREISGWQIMLGDTSEELVDTMLGLPYLDDGVWMTVAANFDQILGKVAFANLRVLDIGAGRAWSSWRIAQAGAAYVMALDILSQRFIGLETADIYIDQSGTYLERVLADMNQLPLQAGSFDVAFINATLHHSSSIRDTMKGVAHVLADDGVALIVSEPVRSVLWPHDLSDCPEIACGINEHTYTIFQYLWASLAAGLLPRIHFPRSIERILDGGDIVGAQELGRGSQALVRLWCFRLVRWAVRGPLLLVSYAVYNMPLVLTARKLLPRRSKISRLVRALK